MVQPKGLGQNEEQQNQPDSGFNILLPTVYAFQADQGKEQSSSERLQITS